MQTRQFLLWARIWKHATQEHRLTLLRAWRKNKVHLQAAGPKRWQSVSGPGKAILAVLIDAGWKPTLPHIWHTPDGNGVANILLHKAAPLQIADYFAAQQAKMLWKKASARPGGKGLELGPPCFVAVKRAVRYLRKKNLQANSLEIAAAGGVWVNERFSEHSRQLCTQCQ